MAKRTFLVSDVHLGGVPESTEREFLAFLDHVGAHADRLIVVGDLFDFWFEYGPVIPGRHYRVLAALADLVDADIPVEMVGGNHDAWGGRFLREEVGIAFHPDGYRTRLAGRPALVVHGDGVGRGDLKYRMLKKVLRSRPAVLGFRWLHPELGVRLAGAVSTTHDKAERDEAVHSRAGHIREWARERLEAEPGLGWVVCGHAHLPEILEVAPGRHYLNAGDWVRHHTYITVDRDGRPALRSWTGQAARS